MSLAKIIKYTYEDYKNWEGEWELIDGFPVAMAPSPTKKYQILARELLFNFQKSIDDNKSINCEVIYETDWKIDSENVVRPDIVFVCNDNSIEYITKTPQVIAEILSPSTAKIDEDIKFKLYEKEGVKYYILIYPDDLIAKVYELKDYKYVKLGTYDNETIYINNLECPLKIDFKEVFKRFKKSN